MQVIEDVYPSRVADTPQLLDRADEVVWGSTPGPLSPAQLASYERDGFLVLPALFSGEEIARLDGELQQWVDSPDVRSMPETITEPGSGAVRSVFQVHTRHVLFNLLARERRLRGAAEQILGSRVYMHQSRINLKPGFSGKDFYWHSDFETWHMEDGMPRMRALSVSVAMTENTPHNGPLMLIPGSHKKYVACVGETPADHYKHSLKKQEYGVPDHESLATLAEMGGGIESVTGPAGTVVFFDCNTMHGSNSNITPYPRRNIFFVYNSVENRLQDPFCGQAPRPEHIASRQRDGALDPVPTA